MSAWADLVDEAALASASDGGWGDLVAEAAAASDDETSIDKITELMPFATEHPK